MKVIDPASGELLMARQFVAATLAEEPVLRRLARDVAVAMRFPHPLLAAWRGVDRSGGRVTLLREWLPGTSLAAHPRFTRGGSDCPAALSTASELVDLLAAGLEALHAIHESGLVAHRISPHNLFRLDDGSVRITDWGVRLPAEHGSLPADGDRAGYAAPELKGGPPPDPRSDLYALGAVVCQIATGTTPLPTRKGTEFDSAGFTEAAASVLRRLLAADPGERFGSAAEALRALDRPRPPVGRTSRTDFRSPRTVGQAGDLTELRAAVDRVSGGAGDLVFVRGACGIGRTRLLGEIARYATLCGARVLNGGLPEPTGLPLGRLRPCFERLAEEMEGWSQEDLDEALQSDGKVLLEVTPAFHRVPAVRALSEPAHLGPEGSRRRLLRVATRALVVAARRRPLVLLLDDFEGADALSVDLVRHLARTSIHPGASRRSASILVVAAYDDQGETNARGPLRATTVALRAKGLAREIVLRPLAPHEVRDLIVERLQPAEDLAGQFVARVMSETKGSPLEIEETLAFLAAAGVLALDSGQWVAAWDRARTELACSRPTDAGEEGLALLLGERESKTADAPGSVAGLRLRHTSADVTLLLETVALAGSGLGIEVLRMASGVGQADDFVLDETLVSAIASRILLEGEPGEIAFRHEKLRQAVVAGIDASRRRAVHGRIGLAVEQHVGSLDQCAPLLLAHHFDQAGDVERSLLYLPLAARMLRDRHLPVEALKLLRQFFRYLPSLEPAERELHLGKRLQALQVMAETLVHLDRRGEASSAWREMAALAEGNGRERDQVTAWSGLARLSLDGGELDLAESFAHRAEELARRRDLPLVVAESLRLQGLVSFARQRPNEAIWSLSSALKVCREQGDKLGAARVLESLGDVHADAHQHRPALLAYTKSYRQFRALDDKVGVSAALNKLGRVHLRIGDSGRALEHHREALRLEREADDREGMGTTLDLLGDTCRERGDLARAEASFREALALKRELADVRGSADSLLHLAHVALQAGRIDDAWAQLEQALALARRSGNVRAEAEALVRMAEAKSQKGEATEAVALAEDALARARACSDRGLQCKALLLVASAQTGDAAIDSAERAAALAETLGLSDLQFQALARLGDLLSVSDKSAKEAHAAYIRALEVAGTMIAGSRGARDGFLQRAEVVASLRMAAEFIARHGSGDPSERYPVLRLAGVEELASA